MKIITAIGNEDINKKIKEQKIAEIIEKDIQYQEATIEILKNKKDVDLLLLNSVLPGDYNIEEFINIIKYISPKLEIIIILEKEEEKIKQFLISKGINNIYYNNKTTFEEILKKINEINNRNKINEIEKKTKKLEEIILEKNIKNNLFKKENKINYLKNKIKNKIKNKRNKIIKKNKIKIISIMGAPKSGKTIFSLFLSLNIKNKKILIINFSKKNDIEIILGKNTKKLEKNIFRWKKNIEILTIQKDNYYKNSLSFKQDNLEKLSQIYDYIIVDYEWDKENKEDNDIKRKILKNSDKIILLVEANLLGINETKEILQNLIYKQKIQKDNIKIVYNKNTTTSISRKILKKIFSDFENLGQIQYDKYYNFFINTNAKYIMKKIQKQFLEIIKQII